MPPPKGEEPEKPGEDKDPKGKEDAKAQTNKAKLINFLLSPVAKNIALTVTSLMVVTTLMVFLLSQIERDLSTQMTGAVSDMRGVLSYYNESYEALNDLQIIAKTQQLLTVLATVERMNEDILHKIRNLYYFSRKAEFNYDLAVKECERRDSQLVIVTHRDEQDFLERVAKHNKTSYWIGLSKADNQWVWLNGKPQKGAISFWAAGNPTRQNPDAQRCAEVRECREKLKCWYDIPCNERRNWVCKMKPEPQFFAESPQIPFLLSRKNNEIFKSKS